MGCNQNTGYSEQHGPIAAPEIGAEVMFRRSTTHHWERGFVRSRQFGTGIIDVVDDAAKHLRIMPDQYRAVQAPVTSARVSTNRTINMGSTMKPENKTADHVTEPPACADTARVTGPLAGGAADAHPSGLFQPLVDQEEHDHISNENNGIEAIAMIVALICVVLILAVLTKIYLAI